MSQHSKCSTVSNILLAEWSLSKHGTYYKTLVIISVLLLYLLTTDESLKKIHANVHRHKILHTDIYIFYSWFLT